MRTLTEWLPVGRSIRPWIFLLPLLAVWPSIAYAQDPDEENPSRAALLAAERDQKSAEITPPERSKVERALYWYDNQYLLEKIFGGWHGIRFAGGSFPAGVGTTFGAGFTHHFGPPDEDRSNRLGVDAIAARSTRGYSRLSGALTVERIGGAPIDLRIRGQFYEYPEEDFFGFGRGSRTENRASYLLESQEAGAELEWKPTRLLDFGGGLFFVSPSTGSGTDPRFSSIEDTFDPATLPGFGQETNFLRADGSAALDWRDNPLHPHAGGRYGVKVSNYRDQDLNTFDFRRVEIELQQYVPVPNRYRTIALRAAATFTDSPHGQEVPFYEFPTLGGSQTLRGFREFRFTDRNSLVMQAEYRWEAWWALDGAFFVDAGQVAARAREFSLRDFDVSYGVGFRIHSNSAFVSRLDLAFSREGFIPLLRFEHVF
jgi:hypothetical protein